MNLGFFVLQRLSLKSNGLRRAKRPKLSLFIAFLALFCIGMSYSSTVFAACACVAGCSDSSCSAAENDIEDMHDQDIREHTKDEFDIDMDQYEAWLVEVFLEEELGPAMARMSTQMAAVAMKYTEIIGQFLDAQIQMDTQRVFRKLQYQAHKDYRPSEDFCWFGTNVRSLAATSNKADFNALALGRMSVSRQLGTIGNAASRSVNDDMEARWRQFVDTFCDPYDNAYNITLSGTNRTGLRAACDHDGSGSNYGADDTDQINRDVNYSRLIEFPKTLQIDLTDNNLNSDDAPVGVFGTSGDEEAVLAMSKNLYGHRVLSRGLSQTFLEEDSAQRVYNALRGIVAKRSVAQATFNAIVALKSSGTSDGISGTAPVPPGLPATSLADTQTRRYMAAIMEQLLPSATGALGQNIFDFIGYSPSYYSQLEILAKRIYQNPDFYARLYDTPANVARKKVAMQAIEIMIDREMYESQLRREMSISVLLSSKLRSTHRLANRGLEAAVK